MSISSLPGLDALAILNESPSVSYVTVYGPLPTLVFVSDSVRRVLGYEPEQFTKARGFLTSILHPDDAWVIEAAKADILAHGAVSNDVRLRTASGEWRWFRDTLRLLRREENGSLVCVGSIFDVTEEKAAEEKHKARADLFRILSEHSSDLITRVKLDGTVLYRSPSVSRVLGVDQHAELTSRAFDRLHPDDLGVMRKAWEATLKTKLPQRFRYRGLHADGTWIPFDGILNPVIDDQSNRIRDFVIVSRDMRETELAEQKLARAQSEIRELAETYSLLSQHASLFVIRFAPDRSVRHVSASRERLLGSLSAQHGDELLLVVHPDDQEASIEAWDAVVATGKPQSSRARVRHADGRWLWLDTELSPVFAENSAALIEVIAVSRDVTAEVEAAEALHATQQKLREQSELYDLFAGRASEIFMRFSVKGEMLHVSQSHERILGGKPEEARLDPLGATHPDDRSHVTAAFVSSFQNRQAVTYRNRFKHVDGRWLWFETSVTPVIDDRNHVNEFLAVSREISEQVRREQQLSAAREALDESRAQLQLVTDHIGDVVSLFRPDGSIAYMSPSAANVVGYTPDEMASMPLGTMTHPSDRQLLYDEGARNRAGEVSPVLRYRLRHKNGQWIWAERRAKPITDHNFGPGIAVLSVISDITERVEHEREIEEATTAQNKARDQLQSIIDNSIDVIAVFGPDRKMEYLSSSCEQQSGYTVAEFMEGRAVLFHPEDVPKVIEAIAREDAGGHGEDFTFRGMRKDGTMLWLERRGRKVYDPVTGALQFIVTVTRDISAQVSHEQEMAAASAQLEKSKLAAEAASVAKSQFLATMSHELRTPMTGVMGMIDLIRSAGLTGEQERYAQLAHVSAENLLNILNDILDFSKIEAGQMKIEPAAFSARDKVEKVVSLLEPVSAKKGNKITFSVGEGIPDTLWGDGPRIRQVLFNLVGNAVKFTENGRVDVSVERLERDGKAMLCYKVSDTGLGISPSAQLKLFQPFIQVDGSSSRKAGGTGLGLAISKSLVEAMGGAIGLVSEPGKGSTFWFELPIQHLPDHMTGVPAAKAAVPAMRRRFDVLVAEDHPVNQQLIAAILKREGHRPVIVGNGELAVQAVQERSYDIVLMDVQMPVMDGTTATRAIRNLPGSVARIPIVAITANALRGDMETYLAAGMDGYVSKPIRIEALREAMEKAVPQTQGETRRAG